MQQPPGRIGLYDPRNEHDSCGVSFVANLKGVRSNALVLTGLKALTNMEHRGATGAEPDTGDGAGILLQVPDAFLRAVVDFDLPAAGAVRRRRGVPARPTQGACEKAIAAIEVDGRRGRARRARLARPPDRTPTASAPPHEPRCRPSSQLFVSDPGGATGIELDRKAFLARKRSRRELEGELDTYFASLSSRTIVYKGMLTTPQLSEFFPDLARPTGRVGVADRALPLLDEHVPVVVARPPVPVRRPQRRDQHGAGQRELDAGPRGDACRPTVLPGLDQPFPICTPGSSDTARFDEVLELLHLGGYPIHHAMLMMIPEAWENHETMSQEQRDFYRFHAAMMEPWDGPASVAFTDGEVIGAVLDRNGLRPSRYWVTDDDLVVMASEVGVIDIDPSKVVAKGRLQPGKMFLIDTKQGRIVSDDEIKSTLAGLHPYGEWLEAGMVDLRDLPGREHVVFSHDSVLRRQQMFGYTHEELKILIDADGAQRDGGARLDGHRHAAGGAVRAAAVAVRLLQAAVRPGHQPAARRDPRRGRHRRVGSTVGPEANLFGARPRQLPPVDRCRSRSSTTTSSPRSSTSTTTATARVSRPWCCRACTGSPTVAPGCAAALDHGLCSCVARRSTDGARIIVLSDRNADSVDAPIPSLLLTAAVHHHLVRTKQRTMAGLIVEAGDAREVHHMALLIGYGAGAINPYLAFESIEDLIAEDMHGLGDMDPHKAVKNYIKACGKGVLKIMSKMGVSTVASYTGAQIFEAIGLGSDVVDEYFTGTISQLGGIGLDEIAAEVAARHRMANPTRPDERAHRKLELGGEYQWRREGELHLFNPETVFKLQHSTRAKRYDIFKEYTAKVDDQTAQADDAARAVRVRRRSRRRADRRGRADRARSSSGSRPAR